MSKRKKHKKIKRIKYYYSQKTQSNNINPRVFFKKIGIKPLIKPGEERNSDHIKKGIMQLYGQTKVDELINNPYWSPEGYLFDYCHANLDLVKIWYGSDFNHICNIASEMSKLQVPPKARILDVGGGPGHMAFWMAKIWDPSEIIVADVFSDMGTDWGKQIGENRVAFTESTLPALKEIQGNKFDIIVMSRVISFIDYLGLPEGIPNISTEDYLDSPVGIQLMEDLYDVSSRIREMLKPNGRVIIAESWSDARILLVGTAFERAGLYINIDFFDPERIGKDHSVIVFSRNIESTLIDDMPKALSTGFYWQNKSPRYMGVAAETIYMLFSDGNTKIKLEYELKKEKAIMYTEIIEKEGLILVYRASNKGVRNAWIYPGHALTALKTNFIDLERDIVENDCGKIINKVLPD